ncbi:uncharacterized protein LOC134835406 [Culicoides brevitarsis]|uniref:uncharacterized protein LOC134835406 n=1 Tax=Culicoides brevitarsis TaxID=469753 RepID=UPI00307C0814
MCGKSNAKDFVPYVMHRKGTEPLCSGVMLSSKVILTTARCVYDTSIWDLAVKIEHKGLEQENFKLIRKMVHSNFKPEDGQYSHDVALLVLDKELKTITNGDYMCLPSSNAHSESCYFRHTPSQSPIKVFPTTNCDKNLQLSDFQTNLYLNNGSFCAVSSYSDTISPLLGAQPLTCIPNLSRNSVKVSKKEHIAGLLTRFWPKTRETDATFAFVDVSKYVDWINLQMNKLYS